MAILCNKLTQEELKVLSAVLANAFNEDPVISSVLKNQKEIRQFMHFMINYFNICGEIHYADDFSGVALWLTPGVHFLSVKSIFMNFKMIKYLIDFVLSVSLQSIIKLFELSLYLSKKHPAVNHYYLFSIGVHNEKKGKGIGKQLMNYALTKFGNTALYYLENSNIKNMKYYQGYNFIPDMQGDFKGAKLYLMTRKSKI